MRFHHLATQRALDNKIDEASNSFKKKKKEDNKKDQPLREREDLNLLTQARIISTTRSKYALRKCQRS